MVILLHKVVNRAVFRGYLNNGYSRHHFFYTMNLSDIEFVADHYFNAKFTPEWANTADDQEYDEGTNFAEKGKGTS